MYSLCPTFTENGALSLSTTGSDLLNFFFKVGRATTPEQITELISRAWGENEQLTLRAVFHLRNCRGGKGERRAFHECIRWLITSGRQNHVLRNLENISFYGTYKDLLVVCAGTEIESTVLKYYASTLINDIDLLNSAKNNMHVDNQGRATTHISLAAKWAPSEGGELDKKYRFATKIMNLLKRQSTVKINNLRDYRQKVLAPLRAHLDVVERRMCRNDWDSIKYQNVPSVAMKIYRAAFAKHSEERFINYLSDVKLGTKKINAGAIFPHQLVSYYMRGGEYDETIELQWRAIVSSAKNKFTGAALALVDVSGSMDGLPMEVAIALGLLLAEITCEPFRGTLITFTEEPAAARINVDKSLKSKVAKVRNLPWGQNTNIAEVFKLILRLAESHEASAMPKTLYIFSDMQFDEASPSNTQTNFEFIEQEYMAAGYTRPNLVFWNLRGETVDFPVTQHMQRCALVSGFSHNLLDLFLTGEIISPYAVMLKALCSPRYDRIITKDKSATRREINN